MVDSGNAGQPKLIGPYSFDFVGPIEPVRVGAGAVFAYRPQARYAKSGQTKLHKYGDEEFCKVLVPGLPAFEGVYAVFSGHDLAYIGEAVSLSKRWYDYGQISPRKCYLGGQETNCRVNKLILQAARRGTTMTLWFHGTNMRKAIEKELRRQFQPPWNAV